ncbi:SDR family NAD(P)-dependent oxidoreductase [Halomicrobium urmianum]|uniref:SDR family NAD(P)-dependent oxidoreductase n=1 Tax=Halomicrobium urmianum TaxID=1586233 RepID=UPI001CD98AAD|nr:glucose 1-dehydrogenase [Halomicrobium urmianum]
MTGDTEDWVVDPESMFDLSGKTAIVTGAASGLGRAIALGYAARGATVVCADVDEAGASEVADATDGSASGEYVDVTDAGSLAALRDRVLDEHGSYEVLCNVPGMNVRKPVTELSETEWREVIELNLTGVFLAAKTLGVPLVERGGGSVINMASIRGIDGGPDQSAYSASKGGVIQLTKVLAAEWAPDVRVNALAPGYMKTPLVREAMADREWYEAMRDGHMLERFGEPEEVVGPAVYLAADASSFVTGSVLTVDGGWTAQ